MKGYTPQQADELQARLHEAVGGSGCIDVFVTGEFVINGTFTAAELKAVVAILGRYDKLPQGEGDAGLQH